MGERISEARWRHRWAGLGLGLLLALAVPIGGTVAAPDGPQDTIRSFYASLETAMKQGSALGQNGRYARLAPAVLRAFDIAAMTRLSVGPSWPAMTPAQQQRVTEAFAHYVSATYADRFDSYSGEQFQITGEQPYGGQMIVQTRIVKPSGEPVVLNYLMRDNGGRWQIADVYLSGMISQLATQRSEFQSILRREGVDGLILALNRKVDLLTQSADKSL
jgi:phospholipid transport system substrate-binding protein